MSNFENKLEDSINETSNMDERLNYDFTNICAICMDPLKPAISQILLLDCKHAFHIRCLILWKKSTCPMCRAEYPPLFEEEVEEEPFIISDVMINSMQLLAELINKRYEEIIHSSFLRNSSEVRSFIDLKERFSILIQSDLNNLRSRKDLLNLNEKINREYNLVDRFHYTFFRMSNLNNEIEIENKNQIEDIRDLKKTISILENDVENLQSRNNELDEHMKSMGNMISERNFVILTKNDEIVQLNYEAKKLNNSNNSMKNIILQKDNEISQLHSRVEELEKLLESQKNSLEYNDSKNECSSYEKAKAFLKNEDSVEVVGKTSKIFPNNGKKGGVRRGAKVNDFRGTKNSDTERRGLSSSKANSWEVRSIQRPTRLERNDMDEGVENEYTEWLRSRGKRV